MLRIVVIMMLMTSFVKMSFAQERYDKRESKFITKFPFKQLTGGVILIHGQFNDLPDTLNFILDTGSGAISLDSTTADRLKIPNYPSGYTLSGIAGTRKVNFAKNNTLNLPGLAVDSLNFFINDYDLLSSVYGTRIDGVIGYSFLSRYIVSINYDELTISVFSQGTFDFPRGSHLLHPVFTALPIQKVRLKDDRSLTGNFYLDTGAGLCFLMTTRFAEDSAVLRKKRKPVSLIVQGLGGKKVLKSTIIRQVQVGPFTFKNVPTNIMDDDHNALSYPFVGGLLGNDLMRRFNVVLDYQHRTVAIKPNSHYRDLFDYSYTGMNMYSDFDGRIIIDDIVKGSPAARAGFKNGDQVLAVNKNFSGDLAIYREMLQHVGIRVNFIVARAGEIKMLEMKVGRIY